MSSETPRFDLYWALGLGRNATHQEILEASRAKLKNCHPDKFRKSSRKKKAAMQAEYERAFKAREILLDPSKRADYDRATMDDYIPDPACKKCSGTGKRALAVIPFTGRCDCLRKVEK